MVDTDYPALGRPPRLPPDPHMEASYAVLRALQRDFPGDPVRVAAVARERADMMEDRSRTARPGAKWRALRSRAKRLRQAATLAEMGR